MWITYIPSLAALAVTLTGLLLLVRGLRGRKVNTDPLCRKCRYDLTGLVSERCPECGSVVAEVGTITSHRHRRWGLALAGLVLLSPWLPLLWTGGLGHLGSLDGYRYKPAAWVFNDMDSDNPSLVNRAARELLHRLRHGELNAAQIQRLTNLVLAIITDPVWRGRSLRLGVDNLYVDVLLNDLIAGGHLSPAAFKTLFEATIEVELRARPKSVREYGILVDLGIKWARLPFSVQTTPVIVLADKDGATPALPVFPIPPANQLPHLRSERGLSGLDHIYPVGGLAKQACRVRFAPRFNGDPGETHELFAVEAETLGPMELRFVVCMDFFQRNGAAITPLYRLTRSVTLKSEVFENPPP
jgi:hypothetical protein